MKAVIKSSRCALMLIEILKVVKNLSQHISISFREDEAYIQIMDGSHICLLDININKEWFHEYHVNDDEVISMNVNIFLKIISLYTINTVITLSVDEEQEFLGVNLETEGIQKNFEVPLMDIDFDHLQPGENDYSCDFEINTRTMEKYMNELMIFGEKIDFRYKNDKLIMSSSGSEGKMNIEIPSESLESLCVEEDAHVHCAFDIKYISYVSKLTAAFKSMSISFDKEYPLFCTIN